MLIHLQINPLKKKMENEEENLFLMIELQGLIKYNNYFLNVF